jgi:hypothetical protein
MPLSPTSQAILEQMTTYHAERLAIFEREQSIEGPTRSPAAREPEPHSCTDGERAACHAEANGDETARLWPVLNGIRRPIRSAPAQPFRGVPVRVT